MNRSCVILFLFILLSIPVGAQQKIQKSSAEQTSFSMEFAFEHPTKLSLPAKTAVAAIPGIAERIKEEEITPEEMPNEWFDVAEEHLRAPGRPDLMVMGIDGFLGANVTPFWVLQRSRRSYKLVLDIPAHDLEVLPNRTCGLRDIKAAAATAVWYGENIHKFDCKEYRLAVRKSGPIGAEVPQNLRGYETRKPLVQRPAESASAILTEARAQWWMEKASYLSVTIHSKEGDETTTTYYIVNSGGQVQTVIKTRKLLVDREQHAGPRRPIVEEELLVVDDIERRFALSGDTARGKEVPENDS